MEVPWQQLSKEALLGLIEDFVTREGTEYGESDVPLERKVEQVMGQLRRGEAWVSFDPGTETTSIHVRDA